jgi:phosphoglycolate phosphatase
MKQHRPAGNLVRYLWHCGLHPGSLASGEDYCGKGRFHQQRLADNQRQPPASVARGRRTANTQIIAECDVNTALLAAMGNFLLLFDLDGTLVDTLPDLTSALNEALRERGYAPLSATEVRPMIGDGMAMLLTRGFAARGGEPAEAEAMHRRFIEIYEAGATQNSHPYPGVAETLALLRRRGYRTAVCTNKPQHATGEVLNGVGLGALFDGVAGGDRYAVRKPDPGHLLQLIAELGGEPARAAMVGDSENDAASARAAGLPLLLMRYGYARIDPVKLGADRVLDRFDELPAALEALGLSP